MKRKEQIHPQEGKLGVLIPGLCGAVSTTFLAGVESIRRNLALPIGSLTQMGTIRLGKRSEYRIPPIKEFAPLSAIEDLVFGGWDILPENAYEGALCAGVLKKEDLAPIKSFLKPIKPWPAAFNKFLTKNLRARHIKPLTKHLDTIASIKEDIERFKKETNASRCVMIWCGSTEAYLEPSEIHATLQGFEKALETNHPRISPSMLYAYAALTSGIPYINGSPHLTVDIPAFEELATKHQVAICGKDFKTGHILMKTILAPGLKARMLGLTGWYSTNVEGKRDGMASEDKESLEANEESQLSALKTILQPDIYPELYGDFNHKVVISHNPPRGDEKEGWDHVDVFSWMGYPLQIKINFLCHESLLTAPLVLDLVLFMDLAKRADMVGIQEWLSFYFKTPQCASDLYSEHDLFIQLMKLKNTLRYLMCEEQITHLGLDYYYAI